jgi:hypothetical protein
VKRGADKAERASQRAALELWHGIGARIRALPLGLFAAALLYVALRWLIVDTAFDKVALWMYETYPMGTQAELAIRGVDYPLRFYYDNAAGQILAGFLTVPSFLVFGPTYLALKVVPFVLGLLTLFLLYFFLRSNFGRRAANLGAFLFTLGPPTLVKYSVICSGNHFENLFFSLLAIACFYRLQAKPESARRRFAAGLSAGFALFVFLGALIPIGILAGMHAGLRGLRRALRDLPLVLAGFTLGILPLLVLNLSTNARGLGFLSAKFGDEGQAEKGGVTERFLEFLTAHLPRAGVFEPFAGLSGAALGAIFCAGFAVAYLLSVPGALRGIATLVRGLGRPRTGPSESARAFESVKLVPFVLYLPLAALAYGISNFRIGGHAPPIEVAGYRYFLPHFLFAIVLAAVVSARALERGGVARAGGIVLSGSLLACGLSNFALVDWSFTHPRLGSYYEGYDLSKLARGLLSTRNGLAPGEVVARIEGFPPLVRQRVAVALGFNLGVRQVDTRRNAARAAGDPEAWRMDLAALLAEYPHDLRADIARGAGMALRFDGVMRGRPAEELTSRLEALREHTPAEMRRSLRAVAEGASTSNPGLPLESETGRVLAGNRASIASAQGDLRLDLLRGQGLLCGRLMRRGIPSDEARVCDVAHAFSGAELEAFSIGYGLGLAEGGEEPAVSAALLGLVPEGMRAAVWLGFGSSLGRMYRGDAQSIARIFLGGLESAERESFERGLSVPDE